MNLKPASAKPLTNLFQVLCRITRVDYIIFIVKENKETLLVTDTLVWQIQWFKFFVNMFWKLNLTLWIGCLTALGT